MKTYKIYCKQEDNVSGNKSHGTIYPAFSRHFSRRPLFELLSDGENTNVTIIDKITIEDGTFEKASNSIGYTGQHTNVDSHNICNGIITVHGDDPYVYGNIYSRNRYGGRTVLWRLDCESRKLERPITRNKNTTWHEFNPSEYID